MPKRKNNSSTYSTNVRIGHLKRLFSYLSISLLWLIVPSVIKRFILKQFFTPKKCKISNDDKNYLKQGKHFDIFLHNQKVCCWKWGTGPAIIFAHGWNGRGIQFSSFIDPVIKNGYSAIVFDGPGHGESEGETSSYFQMTDAVCAIVKYINPKDVHGLVGHSFGASAIINALSKEFFQVSAILIAPALNLKEIIDKSFSIYGIPMNILYYIIAEYEKKYGYNFSTDNPINLLSAFHLKALIIHDSEDPVTPFAESKEIAELYDSIDLFRTDGLGHKRVLTKNAVIKKTLDYLNNHRPVNTIK